VKIFNLLAAFCLLFLTFNINITAQYTTTDFIVAGCNTQNVAVLNQSLVFQNNLTTAYGCAAGLDLLSNGNVVSASMIGDVRFFNSSGTLVSTFVDSRVGGPIDIKSDPLGQLFIGTQTTTNSVAKFTTSGTYLGSLGTPVSYASVEILPGNVLWAGGPNGIIDVFNTTSGTLTSTITLDNGQVNAESMYYSPSTNTVLIADIGSGNVYERTTTGAFVRVFTGGNAQFGVTRGPGGDVYATNCFAAPGSQIFRWNSTGTLISTTSTLPNIDCPVNIIWAGNNVITAANVSVSGKVFDSQGIALSRALVYLTDQSGNSRTARSNSFGNFRFDGVASGQTYTIGVTAKGYSFAPQVLTINDELTDLTLTAQ
jgi:Carboxypeptidase regulatory-like domain